MCMNFKKYTDLFSVCVGGGTICGTEFVVLSFHHVSSEDSPQVVRFGIKHLNQLRHLTGIVCRDLFYFFKNRFACLCVGNAYVIKTQRRGCLRGNIIP